MKYPRIYILFLLSFFYVSCGGQNKSNEPKALSSVEKEMTSVEPQDLVTSYGPDLMIRNIKQLRNGNILIAGNSGIFGDVVRYDGKSFTNLTRSKLGSHRFWDILEDRRGNIWFSSLDSGVYYYNGKFFEHFTTREGLAANYVSVIYEDKAGTIWFGTGGGVSRYDGKSFRNFKMRGISNDIHAIMEDKTGKLWIGTRGEAFVYDGKTFTALIHEGKPFNNVWSIIEDKKGNIWFGANGLWRYDGTTFTRVSQRGIYAITEDKKGNIWTTGQVKPYGEVWELCRYDAESLYNSKPTVTQIKSGQPGAFLAIMAVNDGSIWFGGNVGVYRYDGKTITDF